MWVQRSYTPSCIRDFNYCVELITDKRFIYPKSSLLIQHIWEFCQVSPDPFRMQAWVWGQTLRVGPGYEAGQWEWGLGMRLDTESGAWVWGRTLRVGPGYEAGHREWGLVLSVCGCVNVFEIPRSYDNNNRTGQLFISQWSNTPTNIVAGKQYAQSHKQRVPFASYTLPSCGYCCGHLSTHQQTSIQHARKAWHCVCQQWLKWAMVANEYTIH